MVDSHDILLSMDPLQVIAIHGQVSSEQRLA